MSDEKLYTENEMQKIKKQAVLEARLDEVFDAIPAINSSIKSVMKSVEATQKSINDIPGQIRESENEVEKKIRLYVNKEFINKSEFDLRLDKKVSGIIKDISRAKWTISGFIMAAIAFSWLMRYTELAKGVHGL